jgi:two-component system response regulator YesN
VKIINRICDFIAERKKSHTQIVVQKALKYMNEHYRENLSLRSVAESVYLSPNYLGALFRTELGVSFTDQLIQIRIQKAKEMLQQSHLKLYEVAEGVGYQNIGYFTGLFKRITGLSPKEYRSFLGFSTPD